MCWLREAYVTWKIICCVRKVDVSENKDDRSNLEKYKGGVGYEWYDFPRPTDSSVWEFRGNTEASRHIHTMGNKA